MKCPSCGADVGNGKFCEYCGSQLSSEMVKEQEQLNKQGCPKCGSTNVTFRRENQGEIQEKNKKVVVHATVGLCKDCGYTWTTTETPKKRKTWLWVLGWIFIFPLPLTLILLKKKEMKPVLKYGIIAAAWILYLIFAFSGGSKDNTTTPSAESPETTSVAVQQEVTDITADTPTKAQQQKAADQANKTTTSSTKSEAAATTQHQVSIADSSIDALVSQFNDNSDVKLTFVEEFTPQDKSSGHYRTEFRLGAYKDAIGRSYKYDNITVDLIETKPITKTKPDVRLYASGVSLDQCNDIIRASARFFDPTFTEEDIKEITDYMEEHKEANGYYNGGIGVLYLGDDLMLQYS